MICRPRGFTLIETMLAVLLMALLTAAAALSLSRPMKSARSVDAMEMVRSFDTVGRAAATTSGHNVRLVFDLSNGMLSRRDGTDLQILRSRVSLPPGCSIGALNISGEVVSSGEAIIDISPHGWSQSYAVHLQSPGANHWMVFAGLTGQMSEAHDESKIPAYRPSQRYNAD
jgi:prepilin-type N-terminal cleavage/methylation domain-containing protein